jgi:hypothetical protein
LGAPHPTPPPADPRLAAAAARLDAVCRELDRLDGQVDVLDADALARLQPQLVALRQGVDQLDDDIAAEAAGLAEQPLAAMG